jgi:hypothetical protein
LRHDEKTKQFTSKDFLMDNVGINGDVGSSGMISSDKNTVLLCKYNVNENNCHFKWRLWKLFPIILEVLIYDKRICCNNTL